MTVQKKILDLTGSQYLVQKVKSAINDVDSSLSTHIADTDIHVTTADKNKWNNQAFVFRYSSTALVASSTNSNTLLDNTDNLKVGDKVIDSSGVLFSITAIDTANSTFTIGSALVDLALDANVMHLSGNETAVGEKTFADYSFASSGYGFIGQGNRTSYILPEFAGGYSGLSIVTPDFNKSVKIGSWTTDENTGKKVLNTLTGYLQISTGSLNDVNTVGVTPMNIVNSNLGTVKNKWKTFNGVEPSSLSLPSDRSARIDISSYITNLGNGDNNQYIVPANGYIWLHFTSINSALCYSQTSGGLTTYAQTFARYSGDGQLYAFFPVRKNDYFIVQIYTASTAVVQNAYFIPCQGNV